MVFWNVLGMFFVNFGIFFVNFGTFFKKIRRILIFSKKKKKKKKMFNKKSEFSYINHIKKSRQTCANEKLQPGWVHRNGFVPILQPFSAIFSHFTGIFSKF
jgi:hypothetical protein